MSNATAAFTAIAKRALEIDAETRRLSEERAALARQMLELTGLKIGSVVDIAPGRKGMLNRVSADLEPHPVREDAWALAVRGECSPLNADGTPSARETRRSYQSFYKEFVIGIDGQPLDGTDA